MSERVSKTAVPASFAWTPVSRTIYQLARVVSLGRATISFPGMNTLDRPSENRMYAAPCRWVFTTIQLLGFLLGTGAFAQSPAAGFRINPPEQHWTTYQGAGGAVVEYPAGIWFQEGPAGFDPAFKSPCSEQQG